ncbi:MAG: phage antirepressor [Desulfobacterales bacterium]|nr:phage antirepressor [Desulfobacterales bacterium]
MHKTIIPLVYGDHLVRVIKDEAGNPWWVAKDVCNALELKNPSMAIQNLDDDERAKICLGRQGKTWTVNEPGLYTLIIRSNKPEAKKFKRWITHDVLPSIRKTGRYEIPGQDDLFGDDLIKKSGNMYFPMAKLVENADKLLDGKAGLRVMHHFTGIPVDDLLAEIEEKQRFAGLRCNTRNLVDDIVLGFIREHCSLDDQSKETKQDLFEKYLGYCSEIQVPSLSREGFFKQLYRACKALRSFRPRVEKVRVPFVKGIRIVTS